MEIEFQSKEDVASIDPKFVPASSDDLFASLCAVTDVLDSIGVPYLLSGGTLLGAVRQQDLIPGDSDWDLDCLSDFVPTIIANKKVFSEKGIFFEYPVYGDGIGMENLDEFKNQKTNIERRIIKFYDKSGKFQGDIFIYDLFSDGILRRINIDHEIYFNAKMSFPMWYMEQPDTVHIRGHAFKAPRLPLQIVEKTYGPMWKTPIPRHTKIPGYNFAGAYSDSDIETSMKIALDKGWVPYYENRERWPRRILYTSTRGSRTWIIKHEHLEAFPEHFLMDTTLTNEQWLTKALIYYQIYATKLKIQNAEIQNPVVKFLKKAVFNVTAKLVVKGPTARIIAVLRKLRGLIKKTVFKLIPKNQRD